MQGLLFSREASTTMTARKKPIVVMPLEHDRRSMSVRQGSACGVEASLDGIQ